MMSANSSGGFRCCETEAAPPFPFQLVSVFGQHQTSLSATTEDMSDLTWSVCIGQRAWRLSTSGHMDSRLHL